MDRTIKQEKLRVAQFYQKLLYQTLDDCLNKFCRKDVEPYLRSYLEICISLSFFRVPRFQSIFIECINFKLDHTIPEWKGVNWDIDDESRSIDKHNGIVKLFDWELNFFKHIPSTQESEECTRILRKIESNRKWQARIKKRSIAFFQIVKRWSELIQMTVQTNSLFW